MYTFIPMVSQKIKSKCIDHFQNALYAHKIAIYLGTIAKVKIVIVFPIFTDIMKNCVGSVVE